MLSQSVRKQRWCAALFYVVLGYVWYAFDKDLRRTTFLRFHFKQGVIFLLTVLVLQVISALLFFLPLIWSILSFLLFVLGLYGIVLAFQGEKKELPCIGRFVKELDL